jgi:hypothetical protein
MKMFVTCGLVLSLLAAAPVRAQVPADVWRTFAQNIDVGSEMNVRLQDGKRFRATLVGVRDDTLLLQPKTRVTVPVQAVPYGEIASLERRKAGGGVGAGKAAAIGVASGVGSFFAMLLILVASFD